MAIWGASATGASAPVQAARRPAGGSFGGPQNVSPPGEKALAGSIDFDSDGNGIVGYVRYTDSPTCCPQTIRGLGYDASGPVLSNVSVPGSATAGDSVGFSVSARDSWSSISQIRWTFGDGGSATGGSVAHVYGAAGSNTVTVTATDAVGNSRSSSRTIAVGAAPTGGAGGTTPPPLTLTVLSSTISNHFLAFTKYTKVDRLAVNDVPAGTRVKVQCKAKKKKQQKKGCPYRSRTVTTTFPRAKLNLLKPFKKKKMPPGLKITITMTAPGYIGKQFTYTMRKGNSPKAPKRLLHPARREARALHVSRSIPRGGARRRPCGSAVRAGTRTSISTTPSRRILNPHPAPHLSLRPR